VYHVWVSRLLQFISLLFHCVLSLLFFFLLLRRPPSFTLFPYTTLFRSVQFLEGSSDLRWRQRVALVPSQICGVPRGFRRRKPRRSEEHTSELQSRGHLVCRLLLEKKKPLLLIYRFGLEQHRILHADLAY